MLAQRTEVEMFLVTSLELVRAQSPFAASSWHALYACN